MSARDAVILVRASPGARKDEIVGPLGDRLKVRVAAAPEGGRANRAICALIADALGVRARDVEVIAGHASHDKTLRVTGADPERVRALIAGH